jgi:hypothetical protein
MRVIWSSSSQLSAQRRLIHHLHLCLMTMHPTLWEFTCSPCAQPQARPTLQISFLTALHRRIIWSSSQLSVRRRPSLRSNSVSDRNHTPLSGALSQVCVWRMSHAAVIINNPSITGQFGNKSTPQGGHLVP